MEVTVEALENQYSYTHYVVRSEFCDYGHFFILSDAEFQRDFKNLGRTSWKLAVRKI